MNGNTYREKGRALFLAAMMVLSVVAMTTAFAGGAAAAYNTDDIEDLGYADAEDDYDVGPTYNTPGNFDEAWLGQEITISSSDLGSSVQIHEGPVQTDGSNVDADSSNRVTTERVSDDSFDFDTSDLEAGEVYHFVVEDGAAEDGWNGHEFWVESEGLDTSFDDNSVLEEDNAVLEIESDRQDQLVNVTEDSLDAEEIYDAIVTEDGTIEEANEGEQLHDDGDVATFALAGSDDEFDDTVTIDTEELGTGEYDFEFNTTDSLASDNASLEVRDSSADRSFVNDPYVQNQGDEFNITVELEDTDSSFVTVGDYDENAYEVGLYVEDTEGDYDQLNLTYNTYEAGNESIHTGDNPVGEYGAFEAQQEDVEFEVLYMNVSSEDTFYVHDNINDYITDGKLADLDKYDSSELVEYSDDEAVLNSGDVLSDRLVADNYEVTAGSGYSVADNATLELDERSDSSFINLESIGSPGDIATHTAPEDADMESLDDFEEATVTQTSEIAEEDHLLLTVEDFGMTGFFEQFEDDQDVAPALAEEGIYLEIEQTDVASNLGDKAWNNSDDNNDLELRLVNADDYEGDQLVFAIPLAQDGVSEGDYEALKDGKYDWSFELTEDSPYVDDEDNEVAVEDSFTINEREVNIGAHEEVPAADDVELGGTTTVAPGTEIDLVASASGEFVQAENPEVASDRTFADTYDFGDYEPGLEFTIEAEEPTGQSDDLDATLVDADEAVFNLDTNAPSEVTVGDDATLDVTVSNDGGVEDTVEVGVDVGGEAVYSENVTVEPDSEWSESFDIPTGEAGDVEWGVTAGDDSASGTVSVVEDGNGTENGGENGAENGAENGGENGGENGAENGAENGGEDGTPGFGAAVAAIALLASALLAIRRQN